MKKKHILLYIGILLSMIVTTGCYIDWDTYICQGGVIKLVPHDNTSGSEVLYYSRYACGVRTDDDEPMGIIEEEKYSAIEAPGNASNGSFDLIGNMAAPSCGWLPSEIRYEIFAEEDINKCGYKEYPDLVVIYCNENDELTISEKTCAEYIDTPEAEFTP